MSGKWSPKGDVSVPVAVATTSSVLTAMLLSTLGWWLYSDVRERQEHDFKDRLEQSSNHYSQIHTLPSSTDREPTARLGDPKCDPEVVGPYVEGDIFIVAQLCQEDIDFLKKPDTTELPTATYDQGVEVRGWAEKVSNQRYDGGAKSRCPHREFGVKDSFVYYSFYEGCWPGHGNPRREVIVLTSRETFEGVWDDFTTLLLLLLTVFGMLLVLLQGIVVYIWRTKERLGHRMMSPVATIGIVAEKAGGLEAKERDSLKEAVGALRSEIRDLRGAERSVTEVGKKLVLQSWANVRALHPAPKITFDGIYADGAEAAIKESDLLAVLDALVHNALKVARSHIRVTVGREGRKVTISVEDDGPGFGPAMLKDLNRRGVAIRQWNAVTRLYRAVYGRRRRHGVGLDDVVSTVKRYQGDVDFGESLELGGGRVNIRLSA